MVMESASPISSARAADPHDESALDGQGLAVRGPLEQLRYHPGRRSLDALAPFVFGHRRPSALMRLSVSWSASSTPWSRSCSACWMSMVSVSRVIARKRSECPRASSVIQKPGLSGLSSPQTPPGISPFPRGGEAAPRTGRPRDSARQARGFSSVVSFHVLPHPLQCRSVDPLNSQAGPSKLGSGHMQRQSDTVACCLRLALRPPTGVNPPPRSAWARCRSGTIGKWDRSSAQLAASGDRRPCISRSTALPA